METQKIFLHTEIYTHAYIKHS